MNLVSVAMLIAFMAFCLSGQSSSPSVRIALTRVAVVDIQSGQISRNQTVVIEGDRILSVGRTGRVKVPPGSQIVNASGGYLMPGLWDAHVHLSYLGACALPVFVANGITSVRDAGARLEDVATWRNQAAKGNLLSPHIKTAGPNLESAEWLERAWKLLPADHALWTLGPRRAVNGSEDAARIVDVLADQGVDFIKFRNLPQKSFEAVTSAARRRGLAVAGHAPKGTTLTESSEAGIKSIEHAETVTLALGSLSKEERLRNFETLARNHTLVTPTLITDVASNLTPDSVALATIADSDGTRTVARKYIAERTISLWRLGIELKQKYQDSTDWQAQHRKQVEDMSLARRAGVRFMAGTDAGGVPGIYPGFALHEELKLLVDEVGMTPLEALRSAIQVPPMFLGNARDGGAIKAHAMADLVLLYANPFEDISNTLRIRAVVVGGKLLERTDLDAVLEGIATAVKGRTGCAAER